MRKTDVLFLFCVLGFAGLFAARSASQSVPLLFGGTSAGSAAAGVAGESRDVDMTKLRRLLERRTLSDREAEFYETAGTPPRSGDDDDEKDEPVAPVEDGRDRAREGG